MKCELKYMENDFTATLIAIVLYLILNNKILYFIFGVILYFRWYLEAHNECKKIRGT